MKVSDYIVEFLIEKEIKDVFGYPGGMVTHLMDSFAKYDGRIKAHVCYHEQAAAFSACAYAQVSGKTGVAYATSGPGATNLITGICNAYFDSEPVIFITGQVNTQELGDGLPIRQRGFQETNIVKMVEEVTKYSVQVNKAEKIKYYLEKAYYIANEGRKGPVLLDIPMNIQNTDIDVNVLEDFQIEDSRNDNIFLNDELLKMLLGAKRPCIIAGAGLKDDSVKECFNRLITKLKIPVVTSMIAVDILASDNPYNYGFIGAYGSRIANFVVAKSDLIISLGARLDIRQVGKNRENFAPNAKIIRVDIDPNELAYKIREDEIDICTDALNVIRFLDENCRDSNDLYYEWVKVCNTIRDYLRYNDYQRVNYLIQKLSKDVPVDTIITTDVGQNQVWAAQSFQINSSQKMLFSGGHGAMGYAIPAAIGAHFATSKQVVALCGDGGFQMNMQELQMISNEKLPIQIIVFNNHALGMIRHFQEMYFQKKYTQTIEGSGYSVPNLKKLARAFNMKYVLVGKNYNSLKEVFCDNKPTIIEVDISEPTYVFPKLRFGKPNQDQEPLLDRDMYKELMAL